MGPFAWRPPFPETLRRETVNPRDFFAKLKQRKVYKVAIVYAVIAWVENFFALTCT